MFISSFFFMSNVLPKRRGLPAYASGSCSLFLFAAYDSTQIINSGSAREASKTIIQLVSATRFDLG